MGVKTTGLAGVLTGRGSSVISKTLPKPVQSSAIFKATNTMSMNKVSIQTDKNFLLKEDIGIIIRKLSVSESLMPYLLTNRQPPTFESRIKIGIQYRKFEISSYHTKTLPSPLAPKKPLSNEALKIIFKNISFL